MQQTLLPKMEYLFGKKHDMWTIPSIEYLHYVTPHSIAEVVFKEACQCLDLNGRVIWDMFAGVGTDAIRLSAYAGRVIGTEVNPDTYQCFLQNIKKHGADNVIAYNFSCHGADVIGKSIRRTAGSPVIRPIIYFDPPWGENYVSGQLFDLGSVSISDTTVRDLLQLSKQHDMIIKVPYICDTVEECVDHDSIINILTFSKHKLKFYFVRGQQGQVEKNES